MHVVHLAAQPTAGRWAVQPTESADATVAATLGTFDAVRAVDAFCTEPGSAGRS
jgi:hypothetical protein